MKPYGLKKNMGGADLDWDELGSKERQRARAEARDAPREPEVHPRELPRPAARRPVEDAGPCVCADCGLVGEAWWMEEVGGHWLVTDCRGCGGTDMLEVES